MDPHTWYNAPSPFGEKFTKGNRPELLSETFDRWQVYQAMRRRGFGDREKAWIRASYDGEVAYVDEELGRLFRELEALPGDTLTVLHTDHGEEFFDHGGFEHNHSLYEELVAAVLWIRTPGGWAGGPHRVSEPVGLIDIVPTVLDLVGAPAVATDGRSLRSALSGSPAIEPRPLMLGHLMFGRERWGVVSRGTKYILHTTSGEEEVYDLGKDPHELTNLATTVGDARLAELRADMETASGWPVRQGWRLLVEGRPAPFQVRFSAPVEAVGVLDPEAGRETRSNLEWGERPPMSPEEVGRVWLDDDRDTMRFVPGRRALGQTVWITCAGACPEATLVGSVEVPLAPGPADAGTVQLDAKPGTLVIPTETESGLYGTLEGGQIEALEELGYLGG